MPETPTPDAAARQALLRTIRDGEFAASDVPAYLALFCVAAEQDGDIQDEVRGWNRRIHLGARRDPEPTLSGAPSCTSRAAAPR